MEPEQMRQLCQTMHETMQAAMHGAAPPPTTSTDADSLTDDGNRDETGLRPATAEWLRGTRGGGTIVDRTGDETVVVEVGAGDGFQYAPAAVRVDPGTTVQWRWTGRGGLHDVAFRNANVRTSLRSEEGATFSYTFDTSGEYRYECTPHSGLGMRGVVIVESRA
jgi:halocyanin-like protein